MPMPTSSSTKKPASARLAMRATLVHGTGCCSLISPPQLGHVLREPLPRLAPNDVAQFGQTIAVSSRGLLMPDRLEYWANPGGRDVIDYAESAARRPALRQRH